MEKYRAQTPSTYKSPLAAGFDFYFVSPHTIYPEFHNINAASNTENRFYMTVTAPNGEEFKTKYIVIYSTPSGNVVVREGEDIGVNVKLQSGNYVVKYEFEYQLTVGGAYGHDSATYEFQVVQNQYPLRKQTIKEVIDRILRLTEPLVWNRAKGEYVKPPRFLFGYKYSEDSAEGKAERALFEQTSPEFTFTRCTLREALQQIGQFIHAEPRLVYRVIDGKRRMVWIFDRYGEGEQATYTPSFKAKAKQLLSEAKNEKSFRKFLDYMEEVYQMGEAGKYFVDKFIENVKKEKGPDYEVGIFRGDPNEKNRILDTVIEEDFSIDNDGYLSESVKHVEPTVE